MPVRGGVRGCGGWGRASFDGLNTRHLPFPRIFENSQKKSKAGADQENFSKMAGVAEKKAGIFCNFAVNLGGVR